MKVAMKIALGADHRGYKLKERLKNVLHEWGYEVVDVGAYQLDPEDDYTDFAYLAAQLLAKREADRGVLLCGSGMGMDIVANKVKGIRATIVSTPEAARYGRDHDDINTITLPADQLSEEAALQIVKIFLDTPFSNAAQHVRRLDKLRTIEEALCQSTL